MDYTPVTAADASADPLLADWRVLGSSLHASFSAGAFSAAGELAARITALADEVDHHPDLTIRYPDRVLVALRSHVTDGITRVDVTTAAAISRLAAERGAAAMPPPPTIEICIDALDPEAIRPFWMAVTGHVDRDGELVDPTGTAPTIWFQQMDRPRPQRNRVHLDVLVPHDEAEARVNAAISAGGHLVSDTARPSFWVLADAEGNEACVCTWQSRDADADAGAATNQPV